MIMISKEEAMAIKGRYPNVKITKTVGKRYVAEYNFIKKFLNDIRNGKIVEER